MDGVTGAAAQIRLVPGSQLGFGQLLPRSTFTNLYFYSSVINLSPFIYRIIHSASNLLGTGRRWSLWTASGLDEDFLPQTFIRG